MEKKVASGIMLTLLFIGMLTLAFNVPPIAASNGVTGLLNECSTFRNGSKNHRNSIAEENSRPYSVDEDRWNFNRTNEWAGFAKVDGDSVELVIGANNRRPDSYAEIMRLIGESGGSAVNTVSMEGEIWAVVADIPLAAVSSFVTEVRAAGLSRYIEPNVKVQACFVPNDPNWTIQWGPAKIEADYAWNTTIGDSSVLVAVIDTGIDWNHPDLAANYVPLGYDWVNNDADPMDDNGHGTHCAGITAAVINNSIGIAGLAQVSIMAEKGLDRYGLGYTGDLANAIIHAVDQGADILSNSWGGYGKSELIHEAVLYAYNASVLVVAAAGNEKTISKVYPAAYKEVVAVTATNQSDNPAWFTNFGDWVEVAAPGVYIYSTISETHDPRFSYPYDLLSGTSMATPHVAGVVALIWSQFPHMTRDQVWAQLRYAADDLGDQGFDWDYGWGRINARRAVEQAPTEHDLLIWDWDILPALEPGDMATINTTVFNFGKLDESNITVRLLVNGSVVDSTHISFLESNTMATVNCSWMSMVEGMYNITSWVVPVPGETITLYNARSRNVRVKVGKFFKVPTDYSSIQDAVNWASPGYTILVESGIYYEHVVIQKSLKLVGEDRSTTIIDGSGIGTVVEVTAEDVYISGFTIQNGGKWGLFDCGILMRQSTGIAIINNTVRDQNIGIFLYGSYGTNKIIGNTVSSHNDTGIALLFSSGNYTINANTVSNSHGGIITLFGVYAVSNNTVTSTGTGIWLTVSDNSKVIGNTLDSNDEYGIRISNSKGTTVRGNKVINNFRGFYLEGSANSTLRNNNMTGNIYSFGVDFDFVQQDIDTSNTVDGKPVYYLANQRNLIIDPSTFPDIGYLGIMNSTNVTVRDLNMTKNGEGVLFAYTTDSTIENLNTSYNEIGIYLYRSNVTVAGNIVTDNQYGMVITASNVTLVGNTVTNNQGGIAIGLNLGSTIANNMIASNSKYGILMFISSNNTISGNTISSNLKGIIINYHSIGNTIVGNIITSNQASGVVSYDSNNNVVSYNTITNNSEGISFFNSNGTTVSGNRVTNSGGGVVLYDSDNNVISSNTITNNSAGIRLDYSSNYNSISENNITGNSYGIRLDYSSNNCISGNNITNNDYVIWLSSSSNNCVSGNNITANMYGITLWDSSRNNTISGNNITANMYGITLWDSSNNNIFGNNIKNSYMGIRLGYSSNNCISGNNITDNNYGIWLDYTSNNNMFFHNNFISNTEHVNSGMYISVNTWDNGYPSGGNYWSGHVCTGNPSDGSQPYVIDANNVDHYPFQDPNGWVIPGDINGDEIVDIHDIVLAASAFGSRPGDPNWNPDADLNNDGIIDIFDLVIIGINYGKKLPL